MATALVHSVVCSVNVVCVLERVHCVQCHATYKHLSCALPAGVIYASQKEQEVQIELANRAASQTADEIILLVSKLSAGALALVRQLH